MFNNMKNKMILTGLESKLRNATFFHDKIFNKLSIEKNVP